MIYRPKSRKSLLILARTALQQFGLAATAEEIAESRNRLPAAPSVYSARGSRTTGWQRS